MIEIIKANWATIVGGGSITTFLGWFFYGRKNNNAEFTTKVQGIYDSLVDDLKKDRDLLKEENAQLKKDHKTDIEYFRTQLDEVRKQSAIMQGQFNDMSIAYSNEVQVSQNWEKLHRELNIKYSELQEAHNVLKLDHEKLKKSFETYKSKK